MDIWSKVKEILSSILPDNLNISSSKMDNSKISIKGEGNNSVVYHNTHNTYNFNINIESIENPEQRALMAEFIRDCYLQKDGSQPLIAEETATGVKEFLLTETTSNANQIIEKIKDFIPQDDVRIIRAANHVRRLYKEGLGGIDRLKEDIGYRWGPRGRNITNLLTAGYFENYIVPILTKKMENPIPSMSRKDIYEVIVNETAFSVFVPRNITIEDLKTKIITQSIRNVEEFSRRYINIHALGARNVKKVNRAVKELYEITEFYDFVIIAKVKERDKIFLVLVFGNVDLSIE